MRSFRARIERGRIIVHEPLDLPDGVVYLVAMESAKGDVAAEQHPRQADRGTPTPLPSTDGAHRSSS